VAGDAARNRAFPGNRRQGGSVRRRRRRLLLQVLVTLGDGARAGSGLIGARLALMPITDWHWLAGHVVPPMGWIFPQPGHCQVLCVLALP
jgi:hypothetical protein